MPKIYDNIENHLTTGLKETISLSKRVDFCVGYFNLRGWKEIAREVDNLSGDSIYENDNDIHRTCRLLVGMQKLPIDLLRDSFLEKEDIDNSTANKLKKQLAQEFKDQLIIGTPTESDEASLRLLCRQLKENKIVVKLHLRYTLHAKLYLAYSNDKRIPIVGFLGSSNLTMAGLSKQGELNIDILEQDAATKLSQWFNERWEDRWCIDISEDLITVIEESWAADRIIPPYHIYLKIAYHLSREARAGISEFKLPKVFSEELLDFQQKAVLVAAHHLNKRNGVIIGDVVGLGKTITAAALAKMFEDDFYLETLIICPKNLIPMWEDYIHRYHLHAKPISVSMVQRELPTLRRYRLVIIDESHNLRNSESSRYRAIKSYLDENESKVILLSATPYNKTYNDLSNQLRLFIADDQDLGISPERYIEYLGGEAKYLQKHTETFIRSVKAFEKSHIAEDWQELMRLYLVRRTRSFIKQHYTKTDEENERKYLTFSDGSRSYFPDRLAKRKDFSLNAKDKKDQYAALYSKKVVDIINSLTLPRYGLGNFIDEQPKIKSDSAEDQIIANLSRAGKRLMGFCRTNLFKRLESSGYSFLLSLSRHLMRNYLFIYALQNRLPIPIGKQVTNMLEDYLDDSDLDGNETKLMLLLKEQDYLDKAKEIYHELTNKERKKNFDWIRCEFFTETLTKTLIDDANSILQIIKMGKNWDSKLDRKLLALHDLINKDHPKEKILVFTQFSDTAEYVTANLKLMGITGIECVTGDADNPTDFAHRFSPFSNKRNNVLQNSLLEIRVLISTDVLSEGQNLQDAHIVVNYDLPWAIIRLIQRAGRVDRIGQKSKDIFCYSFLPEKGIEDIIKLRKRLKDRINENAEVVGSDERFFEDDNVNLQDLYNEKSGVLDDDEDGEVDLASFAFQIWKDATEKDQSLLKTIPDLPGIAYSTKAAPNEDSIIVYARTPEDNDVMIKLDNKGKVLTHSQYTILKSAACEPEEPGLFKIDQHHDIVKKGVELIIAEDKKTGGTLGRKNGIKYMLYMRMDRYCKEFDNTLFITDALKKAVDDIYKYPLKEFAKETFSRQMKAGIADHELANIAVSLREEDKLCIKSDDEQVRKLPQIICSMGLKCLNHD